jgi:glycogen(starch) synthase
LFNSEFSDMRTFAHIPKRILMTADTVGGVWTYSIELARALSEQGIEIALATMGAPLKRTQWAEANSVSGLEIFEGNHKLEWMENPWDDVARAGEWLLGLEERFRPDVVHLNGYCHGALPFNAPKIIVGHSCVLSWWRAVKGCDAPVEWNTYRQMVTQGIQRADLVAAPSQAMLHSLHEHYDPLPESVVIPNGRRTHSRPRAKHEFIFALGRLWDEAKNISTLAAIASELSWPVYVAGDEQHPDGHAVRHPNVHPLGLLPQKDLQPWLERAPIYVSVARYEPFGLSALEAAQASCALVLGDIPSQREIWGDAALFVPPNDSAALKETLKQLISNPELRVEQSTKARRAAEQFTPEKMAAGYLAAYARLLEARKTSGIRRSTSSIQATESRVTNKWMLDVGCSALDVVSTQKGVPCAS